MTLTSGNWYSFFIFYFYFLLHLQYDCLTLYQLLGQIKRARTTFDNSQTEKKFGSLVIDYGQVQSSVNNKYDYWHKDVLSHFGAKLGENMRNFHVSFCSSFILN